MATTKTSIMLMNTTNKIDAGDTQSVFSTKIKEMRLSTITWPAVMFAKSRIISAKGFTNIPTNSMGAKNIFIYTGTPGIHSICFQ